MNNDKKPFMHKIELSALLTVVGIIILFSASIAVILIAPMYVDPSWTEPTNPYQVQMYEVADPNLYISSASGADRQVVQHLQSGYTLVAFQESDLTRIIAPPELEKYVTRYQNSQLILTSRLLLLRAPQSPDTKEQAKQLQKDLQKSNSNDKDFILHYDILELFAPNANEAFAVAAPEGILENWVDSDFIILDDSGKAPHHKDFGTIYVLNPQEYRFSSYKFGEQEGWRYDPNGKTISGIEELRSHPMGFRSRKELIQMGEHIYAIEGCWYCHTDQTRTLIQDVVLNGSESYPAPPSSANEYIYQHITFPGTRRIGPDLSRVGVKRPSRDWHKSHFWAPQTSSPGSIMPPFQHFFDADPRGNVKYTVGIPNIQFEAIFQYLMTKGTRITPPTQAWWLGKDPVRTKEIIEGRGSVQ
jgi:cytochrome c oxidase cbb3-type subunit 2